MRRQTGRALRHQNIQNAIPEGVLKFPITSSSHKPAFSGSVSSNSAHGLPSQIGFLCRKKGSERCASPGAGPAEEHARDILMYYKPAVTIFENHRVNCYVCQQIRYAGVCGEQIKRRGFDTVRIAATNPIRCRSHSNREKHSFSLSRKRRP